jgi:aspartate/methionine/tyrosine aminotransferase
MGSGCDEEQLTIDLLKSSDILVHPGYFYDIPGTHIVLTFVHEANVLKRALGRLKNWADNLD